MSSMHVSPQRAWNLVGYLDGRDYKLDAPTTREAIDFFRHRPEDTAVSFQLARRARPANLERWLGRLEKMVLPIAIAGVGAAAVGLGLPLLVTAGLAVEALGTGAMAWLDGRRRIAAAERSQAYHQEPAWKGTRAFDLERDPTVESLRLPETASTRQPFSDFLASQMKAYPARYSAVLISGHGDGYRKMAGKKVEAVAEELSEARRKTGKKADLVVLEACKAGNLEGLSKLADGARYAVVAEDVIWDAGLPWKPLLEKMDSGLGPREMGQAMVAMTGGVEHQGEVKIPQMALIDLEKLEPLNGSVEELAKVLEGADKDKLRRAFASTRHFPRAPEKKFTGLTGLAEGVYQKVQSDIFYPDLGDLGGFLDGLDREFDEPRINEAVDRVRTGLQEAVVSNQVHPSYRGEAQGLSIRMPSPIHFKEHYGRRTGLPAWGRLIDSLRPWRTRFGSALLERAASLFT